jgi:NikR C terminal nickel binding domain
MAETHWHLDTDYCLEVVVVKCTNGEVSYHADHLPGDAGSEIVANRLGRPREKRCRKGLPVTE